MEVVRTYSQIVAVAGADEREQSASFGPAYVRNARRRQALESLKSVDLYRVSGIRLRLEQIADLRRHTLLSFNQADANCVRE
jgi:hypothetical protein